MHQTVERVISADHLEYRETSLGMIITRRANEVVYTDTDTKCYQLQYTSIIKTDH